MAVLMHGLFYYPEVKKLSNYDVNITAHLIGFDALDKYDRKIKAMQKGATIPVNVTGVNSNTFKGLDKAVSKWTSGMSSAGKTAGSNFTDGLTSQTKKSYDELFSSIKKEYANLSDSEISQILLKNVEDASAKAQARMLSNQKETAKAAVEAQADAIKQQAKLEQDLAKARLKNDLTTTKKLEKQQKSLQNRIASRAQEIAGYRKKGLIDDNFVSKTLSEANDYAKLLKDARKSSNSSSSKRGVSTKESAEYKAAQSLNKDLIKAEKKLFGLQQNLKQAQIKGDTPKIQAYTANIEDAKKSLQKMEDSFNSVSGYLTPGEKSALEAQRKVEVDNLKQEVTSSSRLAEFQAKHDQRVKEANKLLADETEGYTKLYAAKQEIAKLDADTDANKIANLEKEKNIAQRQILDARKGLLEYGDVVDQATRQKKIDAIRNPINQKINRDLANQADEKANQRVKKGIDLVNKEAQKYKELCNIRKQIADIDKNSDPNMAQRLQEKEAAALKDFNKAKREANKYKDVIDQKARRENLKNIQNETENNIADRQAKKSDELAKTVEANRKRVLDAYDAMNTALEKAYKKYDHGDRTDVQKLSDRYKKGILGSGLSTEDLADTKKIDSFLKSERQKSDDVVSTLRESHGVNKSNLDNYIRTSEREANKALNDQIAQLKTIQKLREEETKARKNGQQAYADAVHNDLAAARDDYKALAKETQKYVDAGIITRDKVKEDTRRAGAKYSNEYAINIDRFNARESEKRNKQLEGILIQHEQGAYQTQADIATSYADKYSERAKGYDRLVNSIGNTVSAYEELDSAVRAYNSDESDGNRERVIAARDSLAHYSASVRNAKQSLDAENAKLVDSMSLANLEEKMRKYGKENTRMGKYNQAILDNLIGQVSSGSVRSQKEKYAIQDEFGSLMSKVSSEGKTGRSLFGELGSNIRKMSDFMISYGIADYAFQAVSDSVGELKNVDSILTEISKTSDMTSSQLEQLGNDSFDYASKYGRTVSDYLTGVQEMSRSGFYGDQAKELADLSVLAQSAGDMTAETANNYLLATNAAYGYNGSVEKLNAALDGQNMITNRNSVSMDDMASATSKAASMAAQTGVSVDELSAMIGTMEARTKAGGDKVGTSLKSLLMNLQDVSSKKIRDTLDKAGASMTKMVNGVEKIRDPIEILEDLAKTYNSLSEADPLKSEILANIGKKMHANSLSALLTGWNDYKEMLQDYSEGTGSAAVEANGCLNIQKCICRIYLIAGNASMG